MFCEHGFIQENCPHCRNQTGIKPLIRLVKPAPREIPMPVPRKEQFMNRNNDSMNPLYEPQENIRSLPNIPVRNFNLRQSAFNEPQSLFHQKRMELHNQKDIDKNLHNKEIKMKLEDIESKFTE